MARMYPASPGVDTQSAAEVEIFSIIREKLGDEWSGLHSLGLGGHRVKPWAEIDFVLIGPPGIFCLEVKGGRVARTQGVWEFTNRYGVSTRKAEGPFDQVGGASAALRHYLIDRLPDLKHIPVGYGVVMPDITFTAQGPDIITEVLCDERHVADFRSYLDRLAQYWQDRLGTKKGLEPTLARRVLDLLRGDFDLRPSLRALAGISKNELIRLTSEQFRVLEELDENPRMIIRGGAGTGKTLLAVEEARRRSEAGERVLLLCFNRSLARYLRRAVAGLDQVEAWNLHAFMEAVIQRGDRKRDLPDVQTKDLLEAVYPQLCVEALIELEESEAFDVLIVDEAQDLLLPAYVDVFDILLKGGLGTGRWRVFLDHNQDIFRGMALPGLVRLEESTAARCLLTVNCRNTAPIAVMAALLSGTKTERTLPVEGPAVEHAWYTTRSEERRLVSRCIGRLLSSGLGPEQIVVLSPYTLGNSCLSSGLENVPYELVDTAGGDPQPGNIRFSTIGSFKGLESDAVILIDVDDLENNEGRQSVYVGASRACVVLAVFISDTQRRAYADLASEYGSTLAAARAAPGPKSFIEGN